MEPGVFTQDRFLPVTEAEQKEQGHRPCVAAPGSRVMLWPLPSGCLGPAASASTD